MASSRASPMRRCCRLLALIVAVAVATAYLPSYGELTKRSDLGQMIRVRAANGQVLVSIGPSFGQWLPYDQIPAEMRAAMISTEDRRFRSHIGVDPIGIGRAIGSAVVQGPPGQRDLDDHAAARAQHLPDQQPQLRAQDQGSDPRARARAQIHQGPDPRALPEPRLFRRRRLWHRRRLAEILRPWRRPSEPRRSGDHRRPGQGAVQLFADRRRRGGARALGRGPADDGQERLHQRRRRPPRSNPANVRIQQTTNQNSVRYFTDWALPQLDTLIDQTTDPIDVWTTLDPGHAGRGRQGDPRQCARRGAGRAGRDRPRRRGAGDGRRQGLCRLDLQPRDPGRSASRARRSSCSSIWPRSNRG